MLSCRHCLDVVRHGGVVGAGLVLGKGVLGGRRVSTGAVGAAVIEGKWATRSDSVRGGDRGCVWDLVRL